MYPDLWPFAEEFYQRPGVEAACLQLQAQGADVCLLLCALWCEARRVPCTAQRIAALHSIAQPWQAQVVTPLRQLRQGWRSAAQVDPSLARLREEVKALELQAERELLQRLALHSRDWPSAEAAQPGCWLEQLTPAAEPAALQVLRDAADRP
jgi:uncharacterized protein (TIGR02444 family)